MDEFEKYRGIQSDGATSDEVYRAARADGKDDIFCTRMLRDLFKLSLIDAKEILMAENITETPKQRQDDLASVVEKALSEQETNDEQEEKPKQE